jgi:two-component system, OmpR family, response regulator MtrA
LGPVSWPDDEFDAGVVLAEGFDATVRSTGLRLKRERPRVPLLLWSPGTPETIEDALDAGYDLWLPAEATPVAVAVQVKSMHRLVHAAARSEEPEMLTIRNVTIDFQRFEVRSDGGTLTLTPTEFKIIAHLARRPGKVVRHTELFREVHGYDASEQEAKDILKVHIWRLRNKLTAAGADGDCIANVRGFGYLLDRRNVAPAREERRSALA